MDGSLSNVRLVDDNVLFSNATAEVEAMPFELSEAGKRLELPINRRKTQLIKDFYVF